MEAHRVSSGRRKLDEIRQKRAAEKGSTSAGVTTSTNSNLTSELAYQLQALETERNALQEQLKRMEEAKNTSMENLRMEKEAAVRAKEDLVAQLRILKKKLQEAEEEQYKAEEDAAALRAEIEVLHHREERNGNVPPSSTSEHFRSMEQEIATLKVEVQDAVRQVQKEHQKLAAEQQHVAELTAEREQLKNALEEAQQKIKEHHTFPSLNQNSAEEVLTADISRGESSSTTSLSTKDQLKGKATHEHQLRELASMIERLESGRQKLLTEIDIQSLEIERLFAENQGLALGLKETSELSAQLERQVKDCLEQNAVLRAELNNLRTKQAQTTDLPHSESLEALIDGERGRKNTILNDEVPQSDSQLKVDFARTKGEAEALSAQVVQLSADLNRANQHISSLNWIYKLVLTNTENRLLQLKQEGNYIEEGIF